jgi:hypothetical protein
MSAEQTENTPWVSFEEMEATMSSWKKKELFKFMTEDQFFSAAFLKGMHPNSKFRKDLINETTKHIRSLSDLDESSSDERMPIFKFIKEYVRVEQENRKFASVTKINDKLKRSFESQWNNKKENNTENAAVAFSAVNNGKMFSGEILSTDKISFEDNKGKKHCYAAVKKQSSLCAKCYPESGIATNPCSRKCFGQKCNLYGFYGHISYYCMQSTHAITGSSVQHN